MINNMNDSSDFKGYAERLKSRYPRDNDVLDLIRLMEMLHDAIIPKTEGDRRVFLSPDQTKRSIDDYRKVFMKT